MSITPAELKWYKSLTVADSSGNGGRMGNVLAPAGVKNNIFPDVTLAERTAGLTRYRKMFVKVASADNLPLVNARVFVHLNTPGQDNATFFPGTQRDVQSDLTGSERLYGGGRLSANAAQGAQSFSVITEGAALNCLRVGDLIRISDRSSVSGEGNEDFVTALTVNYSGDIATITIEAPGLPNAYAATLSGVSSVYQAGSVGPSVSAPVVTSAAGTINVAGFPIVGDSIGTIEQTWTLSFTSATAFNIVGDTVGGIGSGNRSSGAAPINPAFPGEPYFTLPGGAFGGTYAPGDTVVFTTSPAAIPLWFRQGVPAGAAAISGNRMLIGIDGESA